MEIKNCGKYITIGKEEAEIVGISKFGCVGFIKGSPRIWRLAGKCQNSQTADLSNDDIFCRLSEYQPQPVD